MARASIVACICGKVMLCVAVCACFHSIAFYAQAQNLSIHTRLNELKPRFTSRENIVHSSMYGLTNSTSASNYRASSSSKRRGRFETEDGALSPENGPGAYRVQGNIRSENDDIISQTLEEPTTALEPVRIPHAELVVDVDDQDENRMEVERALQAAAIERANRQEIERVLHAAAQENQSIIDRAVLTARLGGRAVEEGQSRDDTHPENEENKITSSSEDRSSFRQYIKPITVVSFLVLLLAIFAFVITFLVRNSSDKSSTAVTEGELARMRLFLLSHGFSRRFYSVLHRFVEAASSNRRITSSNRPAY